MPELPEVEVTARALARQFDGHLLAAVHLYDRRLRWRVPAGLERTIAGHRVERIERRGKYLLWRFAHGTLISHLGMSGSWRIHRAGAAPAPGRHDHADFVFDNGLARLTDPRRFGALLWHADASGDVSRHPRLAGLGIEPFDARFGADRLFDGTRARRASIKQVLLAGDVVVGVGNIYASESLFRAGIDPRLPALRLGRRRCGRLAEAIRDVLGEAIDAGGSTLRDFAGTDGTYGDFTRVARVYGREGQPCMTCGRRIRKLVQGQRATYYCSRCQRP
jgi:formamidopyrimidine-DNA glycosylase